LAPHVVVGLEPDGTVVVVWVIARRADDEVYQLAMSRLMRHPEEAARELATALEEIWRR